MNLRITAVLVVAALGLDIASAHAGPCSRDIAQFEQAMRETSGKPNAGPSAKQSIGAQLDRQPTPESIKRAEQQAQASVDATLDLARRLDAQNDGAGCTKALSDAKAMYDLP